MLKLDDDSEVLEEVSESEAGDKSTEANEVDGDGDGDEGVFQFFLSFHLPQNSL